MRAKAKFVRSQDLAWVAGGGLDATNEEGIQEEHVLERKMILLEFEALLGHSGGYIQEAVQQNILELFRGV